MKTATTIRPIRSEEDLQSALRRLEPIFHAELGTPEGDEAEVLAILIQTYEREHHSWPSCDDPVCMIEAYLENRGLRPEFLASILGAESIVAEVLSRKRPLTLEMVRNLHRQLGIPLEDLIGA